jgi:hypothetical protein
MRKPKSEKPCRISLVLILLVVTLVGCASDVTVVRRGGAISPRDGILVEFEFDMIDLAPVFRAELKDAGFSVAETRSEAVYHLSGSYAALWDVFHYKLRFGQFKVTEIKTGQIMMLLESGDTGLFSAETGVQKMVKDMIRENK